MAPLPDLTCAQARALALYTGGAPILDVLEALGISPSTLVVDCDDPRMGLDTVSDEDVLRELMGERTLSIADLHECATMDTHAPIGASSPALKPPEGGGDGDADCGITGLHECNGGS